MAYEQKEGSGALFSNDKKGNDRAPDYRGDANIDGIVREMACWIKQGAKGEFLSLSFKVKEEYKPKPAAPISRADEDDIGIPF